MDATSATVTAQLTRLSLTTLTQLHAIASGAHLAYDDDRTNVTVRYLADTCYSALVRVDSTEKAADAALARLRDYTAEQTTNAADGIRRTPQWVQQQADLYAEHVAAITVQLTIFETAALPLAHLFGIKLG